jgi:hypothetical protein
MSSPLITPGTKKKGKKKTERGKGTINPNTIANKIPVYIFYT